MLLDVLHWSKVYQAAVIWVNLSRVTIVLQPKKLQVHRTHDSGEANKQEDRYLPMRYSAVWQTFIYSTPKDIIVSNLKFIAYTIPK